MTPRTWAEREVVKRLSDGWSGDAWAMGSGEAADMLLKEHARSVRIVKAEMKRVKLDQHVFTAQTKGYLIEMLNTVLAALQRGRTGRGR
jgi:hypothetical protein